jgi:hypothetical protein
VRGQALIVYFGEETDERSLAAAVRHKPVRKVTASPRLRDRRLQRVHPIIELLAVIAIVLQSRLPLVQ